MDPSGPDGNVMDSRRKRMLATNPATFHATRPQEWLGAQNSGPGSPLFVRCSPRLRGRESKSRHERRPTAPLAASPLPACPSSTDGIMMESAAHRIGVQGERLKRNRSRCRSRIVRRRSGPSPPGGTPGCAWSQSEWRTDWEGLSERRGCHYQRVNRILLAGAALQFVSINASRCRRY